MCILLVLLKTSLHQYGTCVLLLFYMVHHFLQLNCGCVIIFTKKCDDNEQYLKSKGQLKNAKQKQGKHGPLQKLEVKTGAIEKGTSSADRSHL